MVDSCIHSRILEIMNRTEKKDLQGFSFIRNRIIHSGITPSLREIGKVVRYNSPRSVQLMLKRLEKKGLIKQLKGKITLSTRGAVTSTDHIRVEELLQREPILLPSDRVINLVKGKRVMVTGAGGSIGSEIARQLIDFGCTHISLVDNSEYLLFLIDQEISRANNNNAFTQSAILCDVRSEARVLDVFTTEKPDIIFHAAALKHVSMVEHNPCEGVLTNIIGTWNVASAARKTGVQQMVMISTDKAVSPLNIMGASKRIAETLLASQAYEKTRYCVVRFGNVLGSAGSVVPIFKAQIERGGPVTVTDKDVERYFMTIPEAVQLVLHASALSSAGPVSKTLRKFVLEMGSPVKIVDLARQMIQICGRTLGRDIEIMFTGLRGGEKMTEELIDENEVGIQDISGITEIQPKWPEGVIAEKQISELSRVALQGDVDTIRKLIAKNLSVVRDPILTIRSKKSVH